jgi:alpha-beta hydrolase superfamily lysophospholipase
MKKRNLKLLTVFLIYFTLVNNGAVLAQEETENPVIRKLAPYFGLYRNDDNRDGVMMGMMEQYPVLFFPDGRIRGVFDTGGVFMIGNAIGKKDTIEGTVKWEKAKGSYKITINYSNGTNLTAYRIELEEKEYSFKTIKHDFIERQKSFKKDLKLYGSLILPEGKGPFPAIIFAHGSGQESRDASRGLASLFAVNGFACFIFDKRGVGKSEGEHWAASFNDYAEDLLAAVRLLQSNSQIIKNKIGLYGHSQGGWTVPLAISKAPSEIAFAVLSAANCVSPLDQHMYNGRRILRLRGIDTATISEVEQFRRSKYAASLGIITKEKFNNEILPAAKQRDWLSKQQLTNEELGVDQFFEFNCFYDPLPALSTIQCPMLLVYAEKDNYTNTALNARLMKEQFEKNGNKNVSIQILKDANHAMLHSTTWRLFNREMPELKRFADGYPDLIVDWLNKTVKISQ